LVNRDLTRRAATNGGPGAKISAGQVRADRGAARSAAGLTLASPICFIFREDSQWGARITVQSHHFSGTALPAATLLALAFALPISTAAADGGIVVEMNQAKVVKLAKPADTIVVGNPLIADAAVQDASTIVLTAKGFGVTNLVVLDGNGNAIVDEQVTVVRQTVSSVRVYRRAEIQTLSCTPYCESSYKSEAERTSEQEMNAN